VLLVLLAMWLCFALSDAKPQDAPPGQAVRVSVSSVTLEGADSIPESIASEAQQRVMARPFQESKLEADSVARVKRVLDSFGYLEAEVEPPSVKRLATIVGGRNPVETVELTIHVVPGPKYSVSGIAVGGTKAIPAQQVRDLIPFHPNDSIDDEKLHKALDEIRYLYTCSGYLQADPQLYINTHRATQTAFYTVMMKEGEPSTIATVKVLGADRLLADKLVTLPELQPGAVFSSCRIREAINAVLPSEMSSSMSAPDIRAAWPGKATKVNVEIDFSRTPGHGHGEGYRTSRD
jgi:outer membrane protein assembly factor BamA